MSGVAVQSSVQACSIVHMKKVLSIPSRIPAINVAVDAFVGLSVHDYSAAYVDVDE
jgi:hypothetical protein